MDKAELTEILQSDLSSLPWVERIEKLKEYGDYSIAFSTSYSLEDQAILHSIAQNEVPVRVFALDTGRLFEQTHKVAQESREKYPNVHIETFYPDAVKTQELVAKQGINGFFDSVENRKACCFVRKVEPLGRALEGVDIWITGLRAAHSENRSDMHVAELDGGRDIAKLNPLIDINIDELRSYIDGHDIPYNSLHDIGYPSIGCAPCTRAIKAGEHPRAGRWWWEEEDKQECGLHLVDGKLVRASNI